MNKLDKILFQIYGSYPCLSPGRYESFYVLDRLLNKKKLKHKKILEFGCGTGVYALFLDNLLENVSYTGIDLEFKQDIKKVKRRIKRIKVGFQVMDARKLDFKNNSFDLVLSFTNLEHIKEDFKSLKEIYRLLKRKGTALIMIPSVFTFPFQLGRHGFHYYTKTEIEDKLKKAGLKITAFSSIGGLFGYLFSLCQNWIDLLCLLPFALFFKLFKPEIIKGDSRQDIKGGLAKTILGRTTHFYRKTLIGRKIHFNILRLIKRIDRYLPLFPVIYFIKAEK